MQLGGGGEVIGKGPGTDLWSKWNQVQGVGFPFPEGGKAELQPLRRLEPWGLSYPSTHERAQLGGAGSGLSVPSRGCSKG